MRTLADICIRRPVFATMLILALVVVGATAYGKLGVDRLPSVDLPTISVRTSLAGASPEEMETLVSEVIEGAVNTVEGIEELRSISGQGNSFVIATFALERDIDVAAQDVRDRVATILRQLPEDVDPPIISKFDQNESAPVITLALSGERSIRELTELADKTIKRQLERSPGVGEVALNGQLERAINVWIDADRLAAFQLPVTAVRDAVERQNADVPGGNVSGPVREQTLRTRGRIVDPQDFNEMVIAEANGAPIRIKDVGYAEDGTKEQRSIARLNGVPTVSLEVRRQSGANTVATIDGVKEKIPLIQAQLPPDVRLEVIRDQSTYIRAALHEINVHLILGSILACLVVMAFMRSWRSTLIAAVAIPTSVISTFGMMWALDFTLNSVTMLALVLMVGIVIDDAIVVLENIFRFVEEKKMSAFEAARAGTAEIALAVLATTLSLAVIFVPVSFMSSVSGRFLYQFGITAAVSVMVSLLVSFTLTPMMSARLLGGDAKKHGHESDAASRTGFYGYIDRSYTWLLEFVMARRVIVTVVALLVVASSVPLYKSVKQEYLPAGTDEGEFEVRLSAPEGTSVAAMNAALMQIEKEVRDVPGVQTVLGKVGGGFIGGANSAEMYVGLIPHDQRIFSFGRLVTSLFKGDPGAAFRGNRSQTEIMGDVRTRIRKYREIRPSVRNFPSFNIGGGNFDIDFVIKGPDLQALNRYVETIREQAASGKIPGVTDADTTLRLDKPELQVRIDRERAADLGVDARDIGTALRLMVGGDEEVSRFRDESLNEEYDVQMRLTEPFRSSADPIPRLYLPRKNGGLAEVGSLASLVPADSASRIDRVDRQRSNRLRAGIAPGYALGDRIDAIRDAAKDLNLPPGYTTGIFGKGRELEKTFGEFLIAFLLSVAFMYMILAMNYESLIHPFTILLSLPLTVPFALASLWLTGGTLNMYSALGLLVLFGVVKKNSILQVDHMNGLRAKGMERHEAIIQGNRDRLRPILMTTLALVAGMLPLAIGTGPGAEERRAVAIVVIGGQTLSLLLTLLVTPVAYSLLDDLGAKLGWKPRVDVPSDQQGDGGAAWTPGLAHKPE